MKEVEVRIQWDLNKIDFDVLHKIEALLSKAGVTFDTGAYLVDQEDGCRPRDWEWDWSLKGPVKVFYVRDKKYE